MEGVWRVLPCPTGTVRGPGEEALDPEGELVGVVPRPRGAVPGGPPRAAVRLPGGPPPRRHCRGVPPEPPRAETPGARSKITSLITDPRGINSQHRSGREPMPTSQGYIHRQKHMT